MGVVYKAENLPILKTAKAEHEKLKWPRGICSFHLRIQPAVALV